MLFSYFISKSTLDISLISPTDLEEKLLMQDGFEYSEEFLIFMANKKDFGERNKNLSEKLYQEKTYYDWSITAFYSSIHFVEDFIFPTEIDGITCDNISDAKTAYKINGRHATREKLVF